MFLPSSFLATGMIEEDTTSVPDPLTSHSKVLKSLLMLLEFLLKLHSYLPEKSVINNNPRVGPGSLLVISLTRAPARQETSVRSWSGLAIQQLEYSNCRWRNFNASNYNSLLLNIYLPGCFSFTRVTIRVWRLLSWVMLLFLPTHNQAMRDSAEDAFLHTSPPSFSFFVLLKTQISLSKYKYKRNLLRFEEQFVTKISQKSTYKWWELHYFCLEVTSKIKRFIDIS